MARLSKKTHGGDNVNFKNENIISTSFVIFMLYSLLVEFSRG